MSLSCQKQVYFSLATSVHHMADWAQSALHPPWGSPSLLPIGTRSSRTTSASIPSPLAHEMTTKWQWKVPIFEQGNLEAALHWCKQFQDLIKLKQLNVDAKFTNARILLTGAAPKSGSKPKMTSWVQPAILPKWDPPKPWWAFSRSVEPPPKSLRISKTF